MRLNRLPFLAAITLATCFAVVPAWAAEDSYARAVLADRPISFHRFNEPDGTVAVDSTGNGHDGAYKGRIKLNAESAFRNLKTAAEFGGIDSRMQIPGHEAYKFKKGDFSIELWLNCGLGLKRRGEILTFKGEGKDFGIFKSIGNTNLIAVARPNRPFQAQTDPFDVNVWHHAVYFRQSGVDGWYFNGELSGTSTANDLNFDLNVDILIGANHFGNPNVANPGYAWIGSIDELAIYNKALSAEQARAHYRAAQQD